MPGEAVAITDTAGDGCVIAAHDSCTITAGYGCNITVDDGCTIAGGHGSVITIYRIRDGKRRIIVGVIGETLDAAGETLKPNMPYRLNTKGKFTAVTKEAV